MRSTEMQRRALAARDAHAALCDLKRLIDDATRTTHAAELEAIGLAISSRPTEIRTTLRTVVEHLRSPKVEAVLSQVREKLEMAASSESTK